MPLSIPALTTELQEDPLGLGYATPISAGNDVALAELLNLSSGPGSASVSELALSKADFQLSIMPAILVLAAASDALKAKWDRILSVLQSVEVVRLTHPGVQALFTMAVSDGLLSLAQAQAQAVGVRPGSRAEVLFGAGTRISIHDISLALRGDS